MFLALRAFLELLRYDVLTRLFGFRAVSRGIRAWRRPAVPPAVELEAAVCGAVAAACCLYWKPVQCLQRSTVTMRLLRARGIPAELVVGYRPDPMFHHAWVEVGGRALNDSTGFQQKLLVLHRIGN